MADGPRSAPPRYGRQPGREAAGGASERRLNQAGRPTQAELERRKTRVMEVATELFVAQGFAGTSLVEIAKEAGVATRTLYQHFGDKERLFRDVIFARDAGPEIERPALKPGDTLFELLVRTAHYACDAAMRYRSVGLMRLIIAESQRFPALTKKVSDTSYKWLQRNIATVFEEAARQGLTPLEDHELSARLFIDLILGSAPLRAYANWQTSQPTDEEIEVKTDFFIRGRFGARVAETARTSRIATTG